VTRKKREVVESLISVLNLHKERMISVTKERREIVEGIRLAVSLMKLQGKNESLAEAVVYYGQEDNVTLEEVREVLGIEKRIKKAA
jgi:hypothetical protein